MRISGMIVVAGLALASCATLPREPNEDQIETAVALKFRDLKGAVGIIPGLESLTGLAELQGLRKQGCTATDDVRRSGYRCTVTLDVRTPLLGTLHPTLDLRFIETSGGWAVADFL